jgi:hypothetical protein
VKCCGLLTHSLLPFRSILINWQPTGVFAQPAFYNGSIETLPWSEHTMLAATTFQIYFLSMQQSKVCGQVCFDYLHVIVQYQVSLCTGSMDLEGGPVWVKGLLSGSNQKFWMRQISHIDSKACLFGGHLSCYLILKPYFRMSMMEQISPKCPQFMTPEKDWH